MGVIQSSVLGPLLWNIAYNGMLELPYGDGVSAIAYADDLLAMIEGDTVEEIKAKTRGSFDMVKA